MALFDFVGGTTESWSKVFTNQRTVNWYPEIDKDGRYVTALRCTPGLKLFKDLGTNKPVIGLHEANGELFAISDNKLFKIDGSVTEIGSLVIDNDYIVMADNGLQLFIPCGAQGYIYTFATGKLEQITDSDFTGTNSVTFMDGYFIFTRGGGQFAISKLYDGLTYDALDFATAESNPDDLVAVMANRSDLWLFGKETIEVWYNSGDVNFPFTRNAGGTINIGCAARNSVAKINNIIFWLGSGKEGEGAVWAVLGGYTPERISTIGLEEKIRGYSNISDAIAYTYQESGHYFYVLTFPTERKTWVYDVTTGLWHERESYKHGRHRSNCYAYFNRKHIVGDYSNGKLYYLDLDTYTDDGDPIVRERIAKNIHADEDYFSLVKLEILFSRGFGLTTGQGSDPQAMLDYSDDNGYTWSNERWVPIGKIGEYNRRAIWRKLGVSRNRMFRVRVSDPVKSDIIGAIV